MPTSQEELEKLKQENEQLRAQLDKIATSKGNRRKRTFWFAKKFSGAFAGKWLRNSFVRLYKEIPENNIQKETLADVSASLLWRLTRIGVLTLFFAILPTIILLFQTNLLMRQNKILEQQNVRLDQQTNLAEANRRGTVTLEMSNIMNQIDHEINSVGGIRHSTKTRLISHVQSLKPYKFLENDQLIDTPLSPERAQLFLYLITSKLPLDNKIDIFKNTKFAQTDLKGAYLNLIDVSDAKLPDSRMDNIELLGSDWDGVEMQHTTIHKSHIEGSSFMSSDFSSLESDQTAWFQVNFKNCDFKNASLSNSLFNNVSFRNCNWEGVDFQNSVFSTAAFNGSGDISNANWDKAIVDSENWLEDLKTNKVKGADRMIESYKVADDIDLDENFTDHQWLSRFKSMNKGKRFYLLEKR